MIEYRVAIFGLARFQRSSRPTPLSRGDHFMQNDMVKTGIRVFFAPKAFKRHWLDSTEDVI